MCGIVGVFNRQSASKLAASALDAMKERGKDGAGVATERKVSIAKTPDKLSHLPGKNVLGHVLHAIVHDVEQPICKKGIISVNGEIYNWKELKEKHGFHSRNDSELILDLIEKDGIAEAIKEFDGVFAFAYWKGNRVTIARDILGVKPLWYSIEDGFCFASEKKALGAIGCTDIEELNPRTVLTYTTKGITTRKRPFLRPSEKGDTEAIIKEAITKRIPERKVGLLFSGGLDSTVIAKILKDHGTEFTCYTAALKVRGMKEADDLVYAKKVAKKLGLKLKIKELSGCDSCSMGPGGPLVPNNPLHDSHQSGSSLTSANIVEGIDPLLAPRNRLLFSPTLSGETATIASSSGPSFLTDMDQLRMYIRDDDSTTSPTLTLRLYDAGNFPAGPAISLDPYIGGVISEDWIETDIPLADFGVMDSAAFEFGYLQIEVFGDIEPVSLMDTYFVDVS